MKRWLLIKNARHLIGMNQTEFATMLGVKPNQVSRWESDRDNINDLRIHQIKDHYEHKTGDSELFKDEIMKILFHEKGGK